MNGGSTRLWSGVQCSVMRRRLKDLGEFPNCLTTGSKTARCTAPWVGFSVFPLTSRIEAVHVPPPHPPRQLFSSNLRIHGRFRIDRWLAGDRKAGEEKRRGSRRRVES